MLELNQRVHYGTDASLRAEYRKAIAATSDKFYRHIGPIQVWFERHQRQGSHPLKLAAEVYVSIVGQPQLFIEGNHRTGSLIANWINLSNGYPPFVLSVENAIPYFRPSAEIKSFVNTTTWRGRAQLPKYRKRFRTFWEGHMDTRYLESREVV